MSFFDWLTNINGWAMLLGFGGLGAIIRYPVLELIKLLQGLRLGVLATLHTNIYKLGYEVIARGWVTPPELDDMIYSYKPYRLLGGNGTGEDIYNRVRALPIKGIQTSKEDLLDLEKRAQEHIDS